MKFKITLAKLKTYWKIWDIICLSSCILLYGIFGIYNYDIVQPFLELQVYGSFYFLIAVVCLVLLILQVVNKNKKTRKNVLIFSLTFSVLRLVLLIYLTWIIFYDINFGPVNGAAG